MGPAVVDHVIKADLQMLHQSAAVIGVAVIGRFFIQDGEIAGFLDVSRGARDQPQGIVIETAANIVVALLGQGLELVVAPAVPKLGGGDIQNTLPGALGNLVHKAQQVLRRIPETHAATDAAFKHGGRAAHIEGDHALVRVPDVHHSAQLFIVGGEGIVG